MNLLLLSNSRMPDTGYLAHAMEAVAELAAGCQRVVFFPFAGVTIGWDDYTQTVREAFAPIGLSVVGAHTREGSDIVFRKSDLIFVGGGNTFRLLAECRQRGWLNKIRMAVADGSAYMGSSAGSVLACPTIRTTNDMPIVDPKGLEALGLVPFQLNCHFTDYMPPGHQGETRRQRISEFLTLSPSERVIGLPEGDWIRVRGAEYRLGGPLPAWEFRHGYDPVSYQAGVIL
jgi:dipeptidase E